MELSRGEWDDFRFEPAILAHCQQPQCHREIEAAGAAGAGIEVENAVAAVEVGHVRVAEEDGGKFSGGGVQVQGLEIVEHVDIAAGDEGHFGLRQLAAGAFAVHVAADGGDGGDLAQILENGGLAHVAEVEDLLDAGEGGDDLWTEEAVGIADDADFHEVLRGAGLMEGCGFPHLAR